MDIATEEFPEHFVEPARGSERLRMDIIVLMLLFSFFFLKLSFEVVEVGSKSNSKKDQKK